MSDKSSNIPQVTFSVQVYRLLLNAYPAKFQQEYGLHMAQVFRDCCLRTFYQRGTSGILKLWAITIIDLLSSVLAEHLQKENEMTKSKFIKLSGWSFIFGAIAFLPGAIGMLFYKSQTINWNTPPMQLAAFAVFSAPVLLAVGLLGLRARYKIGGGVLLFGAIVGGLLVIVGTLVQFLTPDYSVSETYYFVWLGGVLVLNICLFIFGVLALIQKPLPRWNWLPLATGAWILLLPLLAGIMGDSPSPTIFSAVLVIMTVAQVMLGYALQADAPQEMATA